MFRGRAGPGIIDAGAVSFSAGSCFDVELNGTTPGLGGYDKLMVTSVDLGGAVMNPSLGLDMPRWLG